MPSWNSKFTSKAGISPHTQKCSPRADPGVPAPYSAQEPAPRLLPVLHNTGRQKSCLFCSKLEFKGCTSTPAAATPCLSPQSLSTHISSAALHSPKAGENTCRIFPLISTEMAAQSSRVRMKIKPPLQKVTQDNILQPSSQWT